MLFRQLISGLLLGWLALTSWPSAAAGEEAAEIATYELSLFGYQIGMTYDDAAMVRPFHRLANGPSQQAGAQTIGIIDNIQLAEVPLKLTVFFKKNRVRKIIGHFPPDEMERMSPYFHKAFGACTDQSKMIERPDGSQIHHESHFWEFPGVIINLFRSSNNDRFATASMLTRDPPAEETEVRQQQAATAQ